MRALFAGVESESAFWAITDGVGQVWQEGAALGAARDGASSGHVEGARAKGVLFFWLSRLIQFSLRLATGILVAALPVLAI